MCWAPGPRRGARALGNRPACSHGLGGGARGECSRLPPGSSWWRGGGFLLLRFHAVVHGPWEVRGADVLLSGLEAPGPTRVLSPAARRRWTLRAAVYPLQVCRSAEPCVTVVRSSSGLALRCSLSPGGAPSPLAVTTPLPWPP